MIGRRDQIESELSQVSQMLDEIPETAVLERLSLEQRANELKLELEQLPLGPFRPTSTLTFRGDGVDGSHGIFASFGTQAARAFSDAYSAVVAGLEENLAYMGRIPSRASHDLLITGTAIGSFGFSFELPEHEPDLTYDGETFEQKAMIRLQQLIEAAAEGSDDEIGEVVDAVHPRAVKKVADFLKFVGSSNNAFSLEVEGKAFRFADPDQVRVSAERLADENIKEGEEEKSGTFVGLLPNKRDFEFETVDRAVIRGKVAPEIENPDEILDNFRGKLVTVRFEVVQFGNGRPRYTLPSLEHIVQRGPEE